MINACHSIRNVGALKDYLTDITTSHTFNRGLKDEVWEPDGKGSVNFGFSAPVNVVSKVEGAIKIRPAQNKAISLNPLICGILAGWMDMMSITLVENPQ